MEGNFRSFRGDCMFESKIKLSSALPSFGNLGEPFNHSPLDSDKFVLYSEAISMINAAKRLTLIPAECKTVALTVCPPDSLNDSLIENVHKSSAKAITNFHKNMLNTHRPTKLDDSLKKKIEISLTRMYPFLLNHFV